MVGLFKREWILRVLCFMLGIIFMALVFNFHTKPEILKKAHPHKAELEYHRIKRANENMIIINHYMSNYIKDLEEQYEWNKKMTIAPPEGE